MPSLLLYSTNPLLKYLIQQEHRGDVHFVWCSEHFDPRKAKGMASLVPPSSSPAQIYDELRRAVNENDTHCAKIRDQRTTYKMLAETWHKDGSFTAEQREEITYLVDNAQLAHWRPLIYVIPRANIDPARIRNVPAKDRAGVGPEFIIADLAGSEFEVIEP